MLKWIESTGKTEEAAIEAALAKLGMDRDDVSVEILERAKSGFLGIGSCPARIKVTYGPRTSLRPSLPLPPPRWRKSPPRLCRQWKRLRSSPPLRSSRPTSARMRWPPGSRSSSPDSWPIWARSPLPGSPWTSGATTRWNWWVRTWAA